MYEKLVSKRDGCAKSSKMRDLWDGECVKVEELVRLECSELHNNGESLTPTFLMRKTWPPSFHDMP